jgi:hypothetical protein
MRCSTIASASLKGPDQRRRRLAFWGTLALMRCVGSSPAAAVSALRNRLAADPERLEEQVFDDDANEADAFDVEPAPGLEEAGPLASLVARAEGLTRAADPKLEATVKILKPLIADGANPVVFCRFIATADHVAAGLRKPFRRAEGWSPRLALARPTSPWQSLQRSRSVPTSHLSGSCNG